MSDVSDQRRYYERMIDEITATYREQFDQLQAENDKLRELVLVLCYCMHESTDCDGCRLNDGAGRMALDAFWACDGLHEKLRELGVEVDE